MLSMRLRIGVLAGTAAGVAALVAVVRRLTGDPWWLALVLLGGAAALVSALPVASLLAAERDHRRYGGAPSGAEWLIGRTAVVVRPLGPEGLVAVHGELWRARTTGDGVVPAGAEVVVIGCRGLRLEVAVVPVDLVTAPGW